MEITVRRYSCLGCPANQTGLRTGTLAVAAATAKRLSAKEICQLHRGCANAAGIVAALLQSVPWRFLI
jgi:hypothetical protein